MKVEGGPFQLQQQQQHIAEKIKLNEFDAHLRNMSSPQHGDHPLVWAHYLRYFIGPNSATCRLTPSKNGWVSQRIICQFLRLQPLFIE